MIQIGLVGFLVTGAFLGRAYFDYYFMFVAITVMLKHFGNEQKRTLASDEARSMGAEHVEEAPWTEAPVGMQSISYSC